MIGLIRALYSLLEDILLAQSGCGALVRNIDITQEVLRISGSVSLEWVEGAVRGLGQVESGMRRNLLRSLALDSFAGQLAEAEFAIVTTVDSLPVNWHWILEPTSATILSIS